MLHARLPLRVSELARASDLSRQVVTSALATLEKRGIARRSRAGDHDVFAPDLESPYFPAAYLTALVDLPLRASLAGQHLVAAYVFGSMATPGAATHGSDIDLLIVGDFENKADVRAAVSVVGERLERRVDAFLLSPEEVESSRRSGDMRVAAALGGVRLFGQV